MRLQLHAPNVQGFRARYNIAPGNQHFIVRRIGNARFIEPATWGLLDKERGLHINARIETAAEKPTFRAAFSSRRCAIPADGFFEWKQAGKERAPIWFRKPDRSLMLFAGIFEHAPGNVPRFAILTCVPNAVVRDVHDRMPVVLDDAQVDLWLSGAEFVPNAPNLDATPVSSRINSVVFDDPACVEAPAPKRQLSLL